MFVNCFFFFFNCFFLLLFRDSVLICATLLVGCGRRGCTCVFCCKGCSHHGNIVFLQQNPGKMIWSPPLMCLRVHTAHAHAYTRTHAHCGLYSSVCTLSSTFVTDQSQGFPVDFAHQLHEFLQFTLILSRRWRALKVTNAFYTAGFQFKRG